MALELIFSGRIWQAGDRTVGWVSGSGTECIDGQAITQSGIQAFVLLFDHSLDALFTQSNNRKCQLKQQSAKCLASTRLARLYYFIIFDLNIFDIDICGLSRTPLDGLHLLPFSFLFRIEIRELCVNWNRCRGPKAAIDPDTDKCCSD